MENRSPVDNRSACLIINESTFYKASLVLNTSIIIIIISM